MSRVSFIKKRIIKVLLVAAVFIVLACSLTTPAYAGTGISDELKALIKSYYVNGVSDDLLNSATSVEEIMKSLKDPNSVYFKPEEYTDFINSIDNKFSGIGIQIQMVQDGIKIVSVFSGSPAEKADLKAGDIITMADGNTLSGLSSEKAIAYIKGPEGTTVRLLVKRDSNYNIYDVVRGQIVLPTVTGEILDSHTGYISISSFGSNTSLEFNKKLSEINQEKVDNYIIDLRNNPGGYVDTAIDIAGHFISGQPALIVRDSKNNETTYFASSSAAVIDKPVIFLINQNSASASEILSAAVKDYGKAFLIGSKTYGKGTVQSMFQLSDGSVLKLTIDQFFSPFGSTIDKVGVLPDLYAGDANPLLIARLLSGNSSSVSDKKGYVKIKMASKSFQVDINKARTPEYWNAYEKIIGNAVSKGEVSIGQIDGWSSAALDYTMKPWKLYYPGYNEITELKDVPVGMHHLIKFTTEVNPLSINSDNIEFINAKTGERISLIFSLLDEKTAKIVPIGVHNFGEVYYLVIHDKIIGKNGGKLRNGSIIKVNYIKQ